jgi:lipid-binding SYLF domain-containing protein
VFPDVYKGAIGFGARFGRGVVSCRDARGWSPPTFFTMSGGSVGFQLGGESADVVLFFMTDRSARSLLESKFTLGGKASVAAGPLGRSAEAATDLKLDAEIFSYATAKGLFAGVSLEGAMVATDAKSNTKFYGQAIEPKVVLFEHKTPKLPDVARTFIDALPVAGKVAAE